CVVAGGVGVYATEYVLERYGRELPPESLAVKIVTSLFFRLIRKACRQRLEGRELCQS
ncbi:protein lysA, partial [Escherichia coli]